MTEQPTDEAGRWAEAAAKELFDAEAQPEPVGPGPEQPSEGGEDPGKVVFRLEVRDTGDGFNSRLQIGGTGSVGQLQVLLIAQVEMGKYSEVVYKKIQEADREAKQLDHSDVLGAIARDLMEALKARSVAAQQAEQQDAGVQQEGNDARPADA